MKKQQYETMVDNIAKTFWMTFIFMFIFLVSFIVIVGGYALIGLIIYGTEPFTFYGAFYYVLLPLCSVITIISSILIYYSLRAMSCFEHSNIKYRLRDFWIGFSTIVILERDIEWEEVNTWLEENTNHVYMNISLDTRSYFFSSKADAMAFKLRWC